MDAIAYIRLSIEDQSVYSEEFQLRLITEYCTRNRLIIEQTFTDNGQSSYTFDRAAFGDLELFCKQHKPKYLIVYHLDRFGRNMAEAMLKVKDFYKKGIKVRDVSEPIDLDDEDPNTFMLRAMKFMAAESELHRIRQRTKSGMVQAAMNGRHANMAPYGYTNARDERDKPILLIDEEKAFIVRMVYREFLGGMPIEQLRRLATRHGYKQSGKSAVQRLLSNPIYAGFIKVPSTKTAPTRLVKGLHTPIISTQDYWLAQELLNKKSNVQQDRNEVPLRGVLHCWCGRKVTAGNSRSKSGKYYWYYLCPEHKNNLSAIQLHDKFNSILDCMNFAPVDLQRFKEKLTQSVSDYINSRGDESKKVEKELKFVAKRIADVEKKYLLSPTSPDSYNQVTSELRAEQAKLQLQLSKYSTNQQVLWDRLNMLLPRLSDMRGAFEGMTIQKKHQFVNWVFDRRLSFRDGRYRTPFIDSMFKDNLLTLKEKGLLEIEQPIIKLGETPNRTRDGSIIEHLEQLAAIFAA